MISFMVKGERPIGVKFLRRLEELERQEGVLTQAPAAYPKRESDPGEYDFLREEMNPAGTRMRSLDVRQLPSGALEAVFESLNISLKGEGEPRRTQLLAMLNLVHSEMRYREELRQALQEGKYLTGEEREIALEERAAVEQKAAQQRAASKPKVNLPLSDAAQAAAKGYIEKHGGGGASGKSSGSPKLHEAGARHPHKAPRPQSSSAAPSSEHPGTAGKGQK